VVSTSEPGSARHNIESTIAGWWRGGGITRRIVDVLEREGVTGQEARFVAQRLAAAAERLSVITEPVIEAEVEKARAVHSPAVVHSPVWEGKRCVFLEGVSCPECSRWGERIVHEGIGGLSYGQA